MQTVRSMKDPSMVHQIRTIYVADKNGNRVFYKITREPFYGMETGGRGTGISAPSPVDLNANTLRLLGG